MLRSLPPLQGLRSLLSRRAYRFDPTHAEPLSQDELIEEEFHPWTPVSAYYPMRMGEVLGSRYQITTKLGFTTTSSLWAARDLHRWPWQEDRYVTIKAGITGCSKAAFRVQRKLSALHIINKAPLQHKGARFVRRSTDGFKVHGLEGPYQCVVFDPLRETLLELGEHFENDSIPTILLPKNAKNILFGIDFLHTQCRLIHGDLKPANIMMAFRDDEVVRELQLHADHELITPYPQKRNDDGRIIYRTHKFGGLPGIGWPVIMDYDHTVSGDTYAPLTHHIQPSGLEAPEVLVGAPWSYSADIWNFAAVLLCLVELTDIFKLMFGKTDLARMVACLGPPPEELWERSVRSGVNVSDLKKAALATMDEKLSLETFVTRMDGEEKELFLRFIRRMLKCLPEDRPTARELLDDPWLEYGRAAAQETISAAISPAVVELKDEDW